MAIGTDISCAIPRPDIGQLHDALAAEFSRRLLGGAPVLPLSSEDILAFVMAGTTNLMWGFISQSIKEQDPSTMCCDNLVVYATRRGVNLAGPTRAKGYVTLTGVAGTPIPSTIRFYGGSSREYKPDPSYANVNPRELNEFGGAALRVTATFPGALYNVDAGAELAVGATISGLDGVAVVVGNGIMGGADQEDCETLRQKVMDVEAYSASLLNEAWYLRQTLSYPGVTRACTDQCQGCCDPGMLMIYPFMEGVYGTDYMTPPYGVPPCGVLEQMTDWMFGHEIGRGQGLAPVGLRGRYATALPTTIDVAARCFAGCPTGAEDLMRSALWQYFRYSGCIGSTLCKDQLRSAIYRALGSDICMSNITFTADHLRFEDDANMYLDCGHFAVVGEITLTSSYF